MIELRLLETREGGRWDWMLLEDYEYLGHLVPRGFVTDLGSVPRMFWWLVSPEEIIHGAIVHDYLYRNQIGRRTAADRLLYRSARRYIGPFRATVVWLGVRFGGYFTWRER